MRLLFATLPLLAACAEERTPQPAPTAATLSTTAPMPLPSATPAPSPTPAATALTPQGWGPLRIGMTRAEIEESLGPDADPDAVGGPEPERCDQFRPARAPADMIVMVEDGRLTRISLVGDAAVRTARGLKIGSTAAEVRAAYGPALKREPHEYAVEGQYLTHWATGEPRPPRPETARGVRYEIGADGEVTAIHAGGPSITYSEGCA